MNSRIQKIRGGYLPAGKGGEEMKISRRWPWGVLVPLLVVVGFINLCLLAAFISEPGRFLGRLIEILSGIISYILKKGG